jgi:hypothetical protein
MFGFVAETIVLQVEGIKVYINKDMFKESNVFCFYSVCNKHICVQIMSKKLFIVYLALVHRTSVAAIFLLHPP